MAGFPHDSITPFESDASKKQQVGEMFNRIAGRYDFLNRFLSAGIDKSWRKKAIRLLQHDQPKTLLDVATGTADMAILAAKTIRPDKIIGIDISEAMLQVGKEKIARQGLTSIIELQSGDAETINFPPASFDAVMVAFGVRNFENLEQGLREIQRVLKPGGRLAVLEFSKPLTPGVRGLYQFYMSVIAPQIAGIFKQNKKAYQYLNQSAHAFPDREAFLRILNRSGFTDTHFKSLTLGICCLYSGRKPLS